MASTSPPRFATTALGAALAALALQLGAACGSPDAPSPFLFDPTAQGGASSTGQGGELVGAGGADPTLGGPCTVDTQCDDGIACTLDACDPELARCRFAPDDATCQNGLVCDGQEVCSGTLGCVSGEPKTCSDGSPCTIDTCDEAKASCVSEPRDSDADGDPDIHCAGGDCDDEDPLVSSKQSEICANGRDDDCDGEVDEAACGKPTNDDCLTPLEVKKPGSYAMTTVAAKLDYGSGCTLTNPQAARDVVAALSVPAGSFDVQVTARVELGDVTTTLSAQCGKPGTELACSLGYPHPESGRVSKLRARGVGGAMPLVLPAVVASDVGTPVTLRYELLPASTPPANETCGTAFELIDGVPATASLPGTKKDLETKCTSATGDLVYRFELAEPRDVDLFASSVDGDGRPAISLRTSTCALAADEVTCSVAPASGGVAHLFRHAMPAGTHFVSVSATAPTDLLLTLQTSPPTPLPPDETCSGAPVLVPGVTLDVPLVGHQDDIDTGCLAGGVDAAYTLELSKPSDVLVVGRFSGGDVAAVALAKSGCAEGDQLACAVGYVSPTRGLAHGVPAGSYRVLAESQQAEPMQLTAFVRPAVPPKLVPFSDACADALAIPPTGGAFQGNTKNAKPDFGAGCDQGNQPKGTAPDQLLRLELPAPKRVVFDMQGSGYPTLLSIRQGPTCPGTELAKACAAGYYPDRSFLDLTLSAGTYFVLVDGYAGQAGPWFLDVFVSDPPK